MIANYFHEGHTKWVFHAEGLSIYSQDVQLQDEGLDPLDDMDGMLHDMHRDEPGGDENLPRVSEGPNVEAEKFYKLMEEGRQELYPGCKNFSNHSFTIRLYLFKYVHGISHLVTF